MEPATIHYSDPTTPRGPKPASSWWGIAIAVGVQVVWYLIWSFATLGLLEDASPKQPLRDFYLIMGGAVPAVVAVGPCVAVAVVQWRRRAPLARRLPALIGLLIALLVVASVGYEWVSDDVLNRADPHGLW